MDLNALREVEQNYRRMVRSTGDVVCVLDAQGSILFISPSITAITGHAPEELIGQSVRTLVHPDDVARGEQAIARILAGHTASHEYRVLTKSGDIRWVRTASRPETGADGVAVLMGAFVDITDFKRAEESFRKSEERFRELAEMLPETICETDIEGNLTFVNKHAYEVFRYTEEDFEHGLNILQMVRPEDRDRARANVQRIFEGAAPPQEEYVALRKDGTTFPIAVYPNVILRDGKACGMRVIVTDVTERKRFESKLVREALYDKLTGLPNRTLFMERLQHAVERSRRNPDAIFAVLYLDLDRFKTINDSLGHLVGDELLIEVGRRLKKCVRTVDTVTRMGGDEFTVLLEEIRDVSAATRVADRFHEQLTAPFRIEGHEIFTSGSVGIALSTTGYTRPEDILRDADAAMYHAKEGGRSRYELFDQTMYERAVSRLKLENELRRAVQGKGLQVYYQPAVSLKTGRITGFEALIRWNHPERGFISPAEFLPLAEETGLMLPIDQWMIEEACTRMAAWHKRFPSAEALTISVNLSGCMVAQANFVSKMRHLLATSGLDGRCLKLEVTESSLMKNVTHVADILDELKSLGVLTHLDDFGTGYSSLSYLHHYPLDALKVDSSFIRDMITVKRSAEIVRTVILLAHALDMTVVAEGVETAEQLKHLRKLKCDCAQGYYFAKPMSAEDAEKLIAAAPKW